MEGKHYSYDGVELEITFFHDGYLYRYETELSSGTAVNYEDLMALKKVLKQ